MLSQKYGSSFLLIKGIRIACDESDQKKQEEVDEEKLRE
jgi:hypothetical protein